MNKEELFGIVKNNLVAIYGAGYIANEFYTVLKKEGYEKRVKYFITTNEVNKRSIDGIPIMQIDNVYKDEVFVFIATHEVVKNEIELNLIKRGIDKYYWIYPDLWQLKYSSFAEKEEIVDTYNIWNANSDNYDLAVRFAAVKEYYKENNIGYEIYKQCMSLFCGEETVNKRLDNYKQMISKWSNAIILPVVLGMDNRIIDGNHRIALSIYHDIHFLKVNYVNSCSSLANKSFFEKKKLVEYGVDRRLITELDAINIEIGKRLLKRMI